MEKRIQIGIKLPPSLVADIDRIRESMPFVPTRTQVIETVITAWVEENRRSEGPAGDGGGAAKTRASKLPKPKRK